MFCFFISHSLTDLFFFFLFYLGALNLTRAAGNTSYEVDTIEGNTKKLLHEVHRNCRRTEKFLNLENDTFSDTEQKNERQREDLEFQLDLLENQIPDLNHKVCF